MIETLAFLCMVICVPYFCYIGDKIERDSKIPKKSNSNNEIDK